MSGSHMNWNTCDPRGQSRTRPSTSSVNDRERERERERERKEGDGEVQRYDEDSTRGRYHTDTDWDVSIHQTTSNDVNWRLYYILTYLLIFNCNQSTYEHCRTRHINLIYHITSWIFISKSMRADWLSRHRVIQLTMREFPENRKQGNRQHNSTPFEYSSVIFIKKLSSGEHV